MILCGQKCGHVGRNVGLTREQKLKVLQDSYKEWVTLYPNESDDQEDSHLYDIQQKAMAKAESELGK